MHRPFSIDSGRSREPAGDGTAAAPLARHADLHTYHARQLATAVVGMSDAACWPKAAVRNPNAPCHIDAEASVTSCTHASTTSARCKTDCRGGTGAEGSAAASHGVFGWSCGLSRSWRELPVIITLSARLFWSGRVKLRLAASCCRVSRHGYGYPPFGAD
jgi:hypothetical protein